MVGKLPKQQVPLMHLPPLLKVLRIGWAPTDASPGYAGVGWVYTQSASRRGTLGGEVLSDKRFVGVTKLQHG
jgi:hypothetical protein